MSSGEQKKHHHHQPFQFFLRVLAWTMFEATWSSTRFLLHHLSFLRGGSSFFNIFFNNKEHNCSLLRFLCLEWCVINNSIKQRSVRNVNILQTPCLEHFWGSKTPSNGLLVELVLVTIGFTRFWKWFISEGRLDTEAVGVSFNVLTEWDFILCMWRSDHCCWPLGNNVLSNPFCWSDCWNSWMMQSSSDISPHDCSYDNTRAWSAHSSGCVSAPGCYIIFLHFLLKGFFWFTEYVFPN